MNLKIHESWKDLLEKEMQQPYFLDLMVFLESEYALHHCCPQKDEIFAAFDHCHFENTKVVIIGQDPYHGPGQANGLSFSVREGVPHPPSLVNIFKELQTDIGKPYPVSGDLSSWASQGVLLLNATLTVRMHQAGSHQKKGWEKFTNRVISLLSEEKEGLIFLLWGGFAKKKIKLIDESKHHILCSGHPSPLSANRGYWFGNQHFSKVNDILLRQNKTLIW